MSFETGLQAFKQNKFEPAIEALLVYCQDCDEAGKVTSQKYMQAHMGIVKSYQALKQWDQAIAHCQTLTESQNHPLTIWVDRTLPKLQKAAAQGDQPDTAAQEEAKPKQDDNLMLLQQGMAAYKKMQCDRAIKLLEEYVNGSANVQSRNYMQAQMTLVKSYKETKAIQKAIALCNQLSTSENFALKSWASKALPKLKEQLADDALPPQSPSDQAEPQDPVAPPSPPESSSAQAKPAAPAESAPASASSFTFDTSPKSAGKTSTPAMTAMSGGPTSSPSPTAPKRSTAQQPSSTKRSPSSDEHQADHPTATSSTWINSRPSSSDHNRGKGSVGSMLGQFVLGRFARAGVGIVFALIAFAFRSYFGMGADGTPLQDAVSQGQLETVKTLVAQGKSLEVPDSDGNTVLYWALVEDTCGVETCEMSRQQREMVDFLLDSGANVSVTNEWQETPLHFAASVNGAQEILQDMLSRGADVNARDALEMTPLHWAVTYGLDDNVEILLNHGADMNAKDIDGYTPLDVAMTDQAIQLLKSRGAIYGQGG